MLQMWQGAESPAGIVGFLAIDDQFPSGTIPRSAARFKNRCRSCSVIHTPHSRTACTSNVQKDLTILDLGLYVHIPGTPISCLFADFLGFTSGKLFQHSFSRESKSSSCDSQEN